MTEHKHSSGEPQNSFSGEMLHRCRTHRVLTHYCFFILLPLLLLLPQILRFSSPSPSIFPTFFLIWCSPCCLRHPRHSITPVTLSNRHPLTPVTVTTSPRHFVTPFTLCFSTKCLLLHNIASPFTPNLFNTSLTLFRNYFFFSTKIFFPFPPLQYFLSSLFSLSIKFLLLLYQISFSFPSNFSTLSTNFLSINFFPLHFWSCYELN